MTDEKTYKIRLYQPGDDEKIIKTFNEVFAEASGQDFKPLTLAHWRWKYLQGPTQSQVMLALNEQDEVVAQYSGPVFFANFNGKKVLVCQPVDAMVRKDFRRGRQMNGAFIETAHAMIMNFDQRPDSCYGSGFPTRRHGLTGIHHLGYTLMLDPIKSLICHLERDVKGNPQQLIPSPECREIRPITRFGAEADGLWERLRQQLPLSIWRDAQYLNWRYLDCPSYRFKTYGCWDTETNDLKGILVLHPDWLNKKTMFIYECLATRDDYQSILAMVSFTQQLAQEMAQDRIEIWLPPTHPHFTQLHDLGAEVSEVDFHLVFRIFDPELTVEWAKENWYWTIGDSDIF